MKVIVTGASGLLGYDIADVFQEKQHTILRLSGRKVIDITNSKEIMDFIIKEKPDCVIHSAGSRDIDYLEDYPNEGYLINTFGTKNIALACEAVGCKMVYISSDTVYDGEKNQGYHEFDETNPINVYGRSKLMGEKEVREICNRYFIIRTAILFGYKGYRKNNLIFNVVDKIGNGNTIYANHAQICSPTYTKDLGEVILEMVQTNYYGTYNVSNSGAASRYELSLAIAQMWELDTDLVIKADANLSGKRAKRARNTVFNSLAFERTFNIKMRNWKEALQSCIEEIKVKKL